MGVIIFLSDCLPPKGMVKGFFKIALATRLLFVCLFFSVRGKVFQSAYCVDVRSSDSKDLI